MLLTNSGNSTKGWSTNAKHWAPYRMHPDLTKRCEFIFFLFLLQLSYSISGIDDTMHMQITEPGFWLYLFSAKRIQISRCVKMYMLLPRAVSTTWLDPTVARFINLTRNCCTMCQLTPRSALAFVFSRATLVIRFFVLPESDKCPCRLGPEKGRHAFCQSPFLGNWTVFQSPAFFFISSLLLY